MTGIKKKKVNGYLPLIVCAILSILLVFMIVLRIRAVSIGNDLGEEAGTFAGKAIGSLEGMTIGIEKGTASGKEKGLRAEDTEGEFANKMKQVENLEVLIASVKLSDFHSIGDENVSYAALYIAKGTVVFCVDMSKANISKEGTTLYVELPQPVGKLYIDQQSIEKAGEYQRKFFNGSAEDGFDAYINTMTQLQETSAETIKNYEELNEAAKKAAENQVKLLASSSSINSNEVVISFREE